MLFVPTHAGPTGTNHSVKKKYIHTYHSRFIPEGVAEVSHVLPKLLSYVFIVHTTDVTGGKPIAV
jgi:hypothetical protein